MKSKVTELGVFSMGIGALSVGLTVYLNYALVTTNGPASLRELAIGVWPSYVLFGAGAACLMIRRAWIVAGATVLVIAAIVANGLLMPSLLKWIISALCVLLVGKTGLQAVEEADASCEERPIASRAADPRLVRTIKAGMESKTSAELRAIASAEVDRDWSCEAIEAAKQLLDERKPAEG